MTGRYADRDHRPYKLMKVYTPNGAFQERNENGGPGRRYALRKVYI